MDKKILNLIKIGENFHIELKESFDKSFIQEVCAFANSSGGKIFLGVSDKGEIKGIKTDNSFRSKIQDNLKQIEPFLKIDILVKENIIVVDVPEGKDKPYGSSKGFFVRIGPNSQKLTRNEIVHFFQKEGRIRFEELENRKADFRRDFDQIAFDNFIKKCKISPTIERNFLLQNLDCLTEQNKMTNTGVLFFTKSTEFLIIQATVVCVLYKGNEKNHILDKKNFSSNLIDNIESAILFVQRHTNLEYKIEHIQREEIPEIPEIALREAIVNAVCHRDYSQKGATIIIEVFDNRVEITSPGGLPGDLKPEDFGTKSVARNPVIASLLLRADYIERIGTGITRMKNAVKELGKGDLTFNFTSFFTVIFSRSTTQKNLVKTSQKTSQKILELLKKDPEISRKKLAVQIGNITESGIKYNLAKLKKEGLIRRVGHDKGGYWEVVE